MKPTDSVDPSARPMIARHVEDLLAFAPLAVGFTPERSAVMLTFTEQSSSFSARVDLPFDEADLDELVETLLRPALKHRVTSVLFLIYDNDTLIADEGAWALRDGFEEAGIGVLDVLRVHEREWYAVLPGHPVAAYSGVPFDISSHPFAVRGIVDGRVTHDSREALRNSIAAQADAVAQTAHELLRVEPMSISGVGSCLERWRRDRSTIATADVAALVLTLATSSAQDSVCEVMGRHHARVDVELWSDVMRRVPESHVAAPAAILALAAWLAGDGALAWCAVDRCREAEPGHTMGNVVAGLLETATSPESWRPPQPGSAA